MILSIRVASIVVFALVSAGDLTVYPTLFEFAIQMPRRLSAGSVVFRATNAGNVEHNLVIEGEGVRTAFERNLQPGDNRDLRVELRPGAYAVYCPVASHRTLGMALTLTVGP